MSVKTSVALLVVFVAAGCSTADTGEVGGDSADVTASADDRASYLAKADVFLGDEMPRLSAEEILNGPPGEGAFALNEEVTCDFVEPDPNDKLGGMTPKFACKLPSGEVVKVKYSRDGNNHEVYSEVLASRINWAIGLPSDRLYPVRVTCNGCPEEPWAAYVQSYGTTFNKLRFRNPGERQTRRFEVAAIERKFDAKKLEDESGSAGWGWNELPQRPESYWSMKKAERAEFDAKHPEQVRFDALRLYAAWVKHADNKADNQRLVCQKKDFDDATKRCSRPLIMIHDLGVSYAGGTELGGLKYESVAKASLPGWTNQAKSPTWKDFSKCIAGVRGSAWSGTLDNPHVSNAGRRMIASRLSALTDAQLTAAFTAARIEEKGEKWIDGRTGQERAVTVGDWVHMFGWMVGIISKDCPES